jgi:hypothetical protein
MHNIRFFESVMEGNTNSKQQRKKIIVLVIFIFIGLCLLTNTNNNPNAIVQRIFRPIHIGSGTIYYAAIFPLLLIYYSIKQIYQNTNNAFLNTMLKRIIIMFLLLSIFPAFLQSGVKLYKSFDNNLNAIYCYRENMNLFIKTSENNKHELVCKLDLENCSSESKEFHVKVIFPDFFHEKKEPTALMNADTLTLHANERRQFEFTLDESSVKSGNVSFAGIKDFEFALLNDKQELTFTRKE